MHRDVSPHNLFVTYEGTVKVVDFGIAKASINESMTASGVFKGKISYAAPEQLTAMDMMGVNPLRRVMAPRFWGGFVAMPLLAAVFSLAGLLGAWLIVVVLVGVDAGAFWSQMQASVDWWRDIGQGLIKSVVFGAVVTSIALCVGYESEPTPEGVATATTRTVVLSSLSILGLDFILTAFMFA